MKPTKHQSRVLAALLALERRHDWLWWDRDAIGSVVGAGGYHNTIQVSTIARLKDDGLVQSERSSWPMEVVSRIRCGCGLHHWGLTEKGRLIAERLVIHWPAHSLEAVDRVYLRRSFEDEVERAERIASRSQERLEQYRRAAMVRPEEWE